MWKKEEATPDPPQEKETTPRRTTTPGTSRAAAERATIGPSITIQGDVSGDEDLLIQGKVEGSVDLDQHAVTVGREGRVKANITARIVTVEGEVEGDLWAQEQVILRSSARVKGDLTAPRVVLEDGASFRGLVDMEDASGERGKAGKEAGAEAGGRSGARTGAAGATSGQSGGGRASSGSGGTSSGSGGRSPGEGNDMPETVDRAAP